MSSLVRPPNEPVRRLLAVGLLMWAVGVLLHEALATAGMALTAAAVLVDLWPTLALRRVPEQLLETWPVWLFVAWAILAPLAAGRPPTGSGLARVLDWVGVLVAAHAATRVGWAGLRQVAVAALVAFLLSCVAAGLQHFGVWPGQAAFEGLGWTRVNFARVYEAVPGASGRYMGGGLLFHRLKFAHVGSLATLWAGFLGLQWTGWRRAVALAAALGGAISVLMFPYARMAGVALLASLPFLVALGVARRRLGIVLGLSLALAGAAAILVNPPLRDRFLRSLTSEGSGERARIVETGVHAVLEHPFVGVGAGQFRPARFADASTPQLVLDNPGKAHNQFLSLAAEHGIPGLGCFLFLLAFFGRRLRARAALGGAGLASLVFFAVLSASHDPLFQAPFSMALVLSLGVAQADLPPDGAAQPSARS